jgi:hypothetical protein
MWLDKPGSSQAAQANRPSGIPMVLQGHVISIQKDSITIRTPNIRPTPVSGQMTPMFIIAGESYKVNISHAAFETPTGMPNAHNDLKVGDSVIVVCDPINRALRTDASWPVTAHVVERLQIPLAH